MASSNPVIDLLKMLSHRFGLNLMRSFFGINFAFHGLAILLTVGIVLTGMDWSWYQFFMRHVYLQTIFMSGAVLGSLVPFSVPIILFALGRKRKDKKLAAAGPMVGQAALLALIISSIYKVFTGRIPPGGLAATGGQYYLSQFRFGILNGGIWEGWPSGHTTTAFAMAIALSAYYPDNRWLRAGCIGYGLYIGFCMSTSIHWLSDVVAGALIGTAIGMTVAASFLARGADCQKNKDTSKILNNV